MMKDINQKYYLELEEEFVNRYQRFLQKTSSSSASLNSRISLYSAQHQIDRYSNTLLFWYYHRHQIDESHLKTERDVARFFFLRDKLRDVQQLPFTHELNMHVWQTFNKKLQSIDRHPWLGINPHRQMKHPYGPVVLLFSRLASLSKQS